MRTAQLVKNELRRGFWRARTLALVGLLWIAAACALFLKTPVGTSPGLGGAFAVSSPEIFSLLAPVIASLAAGDLLAWDLTSQYSSLLLSRGVTRSVYVLGKAAGVMLSTALVMALGVLGFYVLAAIKLPWQSSVLAPEPYSIPLLCPGPVPWLFHASPFLNDLLGVSILIFGTAALATTSLVSAAFLHNRRTAFLAPFVVCIITLYLFSKSALLSSFSQFSMLYPWGKLYKTHSITFLFWIGFAYWIVYVAVTIFITHWKMTRTELG